MNPGPKTILLLLTVLVPGGFLLLPMLLDPHTENREARGRPERSRFGKLSARARRRVAA